MRAIISENCRLDENGNMSFTELKKLAYLMDNPLIKLGWKPVRHEPTKGSEGVPNKLCEYLAENPRLSFFVTPEMQFSDQYGNELKIERWIAKQKMADGHHQHTYIEFDSRMKDFVNAQSNRWYMPEHELKDLDPEYFVRTVNYFETDDSVVVYVRNEEQIGKAIDSLDIQFGKDVGCDSLGCNCSIF